MTDKEYREQKARVQKLIKKWVRPIGLGWWSLKYHYVRGEYDPSQPTLYAPLSGKDSRWVCIMSVSTDYFYQTAEMTFYLQTLLDYPDDEEVERFFVHELMHIFLKPLQDKRVYKEEELVATQLANAMVWTREAGKDDKKGKK